MNFYVSFKGQKEMTKTVFDCKHRLWEAGGGGKKGQHPHQRAAGKVNTPPTGSPAETLMTFTFYTQVSMTKGSAVFISTLDPGVEAFVHI